MNSESSASSLRLDKWLWFARFFKTRGLATAAVRGGKVHVDGERVKPAREVSVGDVVAITRGLERLEVVVTALGQRRGPATEARGLYQETEEGRARREALSAALSAVKSAQTIPDHRPSKRERRQLQRLRGR